MQLGENARETLERSHISKINRLLHSISPPISDYRELFDPAQAMKCSSWPGISVRAISRVGEKRKDSHGYDRTMSECDMMSVSGPSSETLSIVKLLATSLTSYRFAKPVFWGIAVSRRVERSSGAASAGRSRFYWDPEQGAHQLPERGDGRSENRAGKPGVSESPLPLLLAMRVSGSQRSFSCPGMISLSAAVL